MNKLSQATLLGTLFLASQAFAQSYLRPDCASLAGPTPTFDDQTHARWYRRFWTGDCTGLSFCTSGSPDWNNAVAELVAKAAAEQKRDVHAKACRLGREIGFEWARDNSIRKIDTSAVMSFNAELSKTSDVEAALDRVDREAHSMLSR